jgi:hypothetical protein
MYLMLAADGTATFIGDLVKLSGSAGAAGVVVNGVDCEGMASIAQSTAGDQSVGVVVGFLPDQDNLMRRHRLASTNRVALVVDDPNVLFEIQEVSGGTSFTAAEVGLNANVIVAAGDTTTGMSGMELNNSGEATTAGLNVRIHRLSPRPDNSMGENAKWLVLITDHQLRSDGITGA